MKVTVDLQSIFSFAATQVETGERGERGGNNSRRTCVDVFHNTQVCVRVCWTSRTVEANRTTPGGGPERRAVKTSIKRGKGKTG